MAEKVGRLKLNERLTDSHMTPVLEVELIHSAVVGKPGEWENHAALAPDLGLPAELFTTLAQRARAPTSSDDSITTSRAARSALREKKYDDDNSPTADGPAAST